MDYHYFCSLTTIWIRTKVSYKDISALTSMLYFQSWWKEFNFAARILMAERTRLARARAINASVFKTEPFLFRRTSPIHYICNVNHQINCQRSYSIYYTPFLSIFNHQRNCLINALVFNFPN